jgi:hypothetical protein
MRGHSSRNTTIFDLYLIYPLHVSAIVNSAIIRLNTIVRETVQYNVTLYNVQCRCKWAGTRSRLQQVFWGYVFEW